MMTFESRASRFGKIALALIALVALSFAMGVEAQEDHPAFGRVQRSTLRVEAEVWPPNATAEEIAAAIKKLESAAVAVIRKKGKPHVDGTPPSLAEARAMLRVQVGTDVAGKPVYKTDLQLCLDWLLIGQMDKITAAHVNGTVIEAGHPVPADQQGRSL